MDEQDQRDIDILEQDLQDISLDQLKLLHQFDIAIIDPIYIPDIENAIKGSKSEDQEIIRDNIKLSHWISIDLNHFKDDKHGITQGYIVETDSYLVEFEGPGEMLSKGIFFNLEHMYTNKEVVKEDNIMTKVSSILLEGYIIYKKGSGYDM